MDLMIIVGAVVVIGVVAVVGVMILSKSKGGDGAKAGRTSRDRDRNQVLKEANRKLAINPKDTSALIALGDVYFQDQIWDKANGVYTTILQQSPNLGNYDEFECNKRFGISAVKLERIDEAYKGLITAYTVRQDDFECNYYLGYIEFLRKNYDKAVVYLRAAAKQNPDHGQCLRYLGHTLSKMKMHKEALTALKHALDLEPGDKESLFLMAECFNEINQTEQALRIYTHLRTDSTFGPQAALNAGIINLNQRQYAKAIEDLEIGLKHQNIPTDTLIDIKYRLATTYLNQQDIGRAVSLFSEIQLVNPAYKDVNIQLSKYRELNSSRNLQIYQLAPSSEFVTLGRKIVFALFGKAKIKITDVSVQKSDWADILAEVETPKWSDVILIRLIRSTGTTGELILRDFHARIKEVKAGKGICITAGAFSEESKKFVEARLIDLMDKTKLLRILNAIDTKQKSLVNK